MRRGCKKFEIEAKLERQSTLQKEQMSLLQTRLLKKEEDIDGLKDKIDHIEAKISMNNLEYESRMQVAVLIRDIIQNNPPMTVLNFGSFSKSEDKNELLP